MVILFPFLILLSFLDPCPDFNPDPNPILIVTLVTFPTSFRLSHCIRLGRGDFVSLMGKTRPLVKSLGVLTHQNDDAGYGR